MFASSARRGVSQNLSKDPLSQRDQGVNRRPGGGKPPTEEAGSIGRTSVRTVAREPGRFQASRLGDGLLVEGSSEAGRQVEMLIAKRDGILEWPEGSGRETALQAIEDVIIEVARSGPLPLRVSGRPI